MFLANAATTYAEASGMTAAVSGMTAAEVGAAMTTEVVTGYATATGTTSAALATTVGAGIIITPKTIIITAAAAAVLGAIIGYMISQRPELETVGTPSVIASGTSFMGLPVGKVGSARLWLGSYYYSLETQGLTFEGSSITAPALPDHSGGQVLYTLTDGVQIVAGVATNSDTYLELFARAPNGDYIGSFARSQYTRRSNSYTFIQGIWRGDTANTPFFGFLQNGGNNEWYPSIGSSTNYFESNTGDFILNASTSAALYQYYNGTGELTQYSFNFTRGNDFQLPEPEEGQSVLIRLPEGVTLDPDASSDEVLNPIIETIAAGQPAVLPAEVVDEAPAPDFDPVAPPVGDGTEPPDGQNPEDYPPLPVGFSLDFTGVWHYVVEALAFILPFVSTAMLAWTTVMPGSVQILVWASIVLAIMFAIIKRLLG